MSKARGELESARELVAEGVAGEKEPVENTVSDDTGSLDPRFTLWRSFCDEHGVPVETMPGDLDERLKALWDGFKEEEIHSTVEGRTSEGGNPGA